MPLLYICATSASSWSFTESPHFPDAPIFLFLSLRSKPPGSFLRPQLFLLLLQAASTPSRQKRACRGPRSRRVFGLATYSLIGRSRTGPATQFDDPGTKLLADIIRGQPACAVSRHQKVACQL